MGKIIQLDESLANKIAAGEVVERPASVVKELVENAIDANSSIIEIELEEAGLSKIRVLDNGDGIEQEDCLIAFQRHATSKIKNENDLFRIRTLGFRGEALPSIASVSMFDITTSTGEGPGTHLHFKGGVLETNEFASSRKGTDIIVQHLFYNTPARLKYMKTIHTELGNISDLVNRLALAHPSISFRLSHNGKRMLTTNGNGDSLQVLASIYGMNIAKKMVPIHFSSLDFEVKGFVALPEVTRASKNYISTVINGRFVRNFTVVRAIQEGYHTLLPIGRYPVVYLEVRMDPLLVDVNVHPAKLEVRLSKEDELYKLIAEGLKNEFQQKQLIPTNQPVRPIVKDTVSKPMQQTFTLEHEDGNSSLIEKENQPTIMYEEKRDVAINASIKEATSVEPQPLRENKEENQKPENNNIVEEYVTHKKESNHEDEILKSQENRIDSDYDRIPVLYPIGQMHGTYILAQNEQGLYLIDQHAAQERINYEYFYKKLGQVERNLQELLVPLTIECTMDEYLFLEENKGFFEEVGILLEDFGHQTFIVKAHPVWFPKGQEREMIDEMIVHMKEKKKVNLSDLREEAAIMMSCKAAIKANHHLRHDEMVTLLETLRKSGNPFTCPHGRPILIHFSTYEMEKMFKRVM
ncbi:DNA mismatch repair endonuclease MutL [Sutcliffiella rhizosphaerae]|uniref:DNA mismatch repair protein MutL n=1 Tax=Sutcliffiella rhizosphaerae TaxID=2880967 RepID=A0ABN8AG26_9BACI|nr:DNA mismatch repair endonuclease MutL [Sutcliffiella rhizosphaerae]CAG9621820.1 DNA mismatch repair protein MutL [Sutcliffiella rhizosphaerae]